MAKVAAKTAVKAKAVSDEDRELDQLMGGLAKQFGDGTIMRSGAVVRVDSFPTGIASLDIAFGCGGVPQGRIIEIYGAESSGKTTLCLQIVAACQQYHFHKKNRNGVAVFIDAEHALDRVWASKLGVNMDKLYISQPDGGKQALQITERLLKSGLVDLVVVDSVAALVPDEELNGEIGDSVIGAQARMMSQALRKLAGFAGRTATTLIFINQVREKIGVQYGNPEVTPGGRSLKFWASVRASISKGSALKDDTKVIGFRPKITLVKNKVAMPYVSAEFDLCVGAPERPIYGIDKMASLLEMAEEARIIKRNGSNYVYNDQYLGAGRAKASAFLHNNVDTAEEIRQKTYDRLLGDTSNQTIEPPAIDDEIIDDDA